MKKRKIKNNQKGVTLVEMLVYIGLMSFLLVFLTDILVSLVDMKLETEITSVVEQDGRYIQQRLLYDINRADSITKPLLTDLYVTDNAELILVISGTSYTYNISDGDFQLTVGADTSNLNGNETSISNFALQRVGNSGGFHTIRVEYTVNSVGRTLRRTESKDFEFTVGVR